MALHSRRSAEIASILTRHGFGALLSDLGERGLPVPGGAGRPPTAQQARLALEELGPAFIKLGQVLSVREDLLPEEYCRELRLLQDSAPPEPWAEIARVIEEELGAPVSERFASIDETPLAAASLAQVHAAVLADGTEVVVKVQRPGVEERLREDLQIARSIARGAQRHAPWGAALDLVGACDELAVAVESELDQRHEAQATERFAALLADEPDIVVPQVFRALSSRRVLTLGRLHGARPDAPGVLAAEGIDRRAIAVALARFAFLPILGDGWFHADPHPGNLLVLEDGRLGVLDFGRVGYLERTQRLGLLRLWASVAGGDADGAADALCELDLGGSIDESGLRRELRRLLDRYDGATVGEVRAADLLRELIGIALRNGIELPGELIVLGNALALAETVCAQIDPSLDLREAVAGDVRRARLRLLSPEALARRAGSDALEWALFAEAIPRTGRRVLRRLDRDELEVGVRMPDVDGAARRIDQAVNRLAVALIVSAMLLAVGLIAPSLDPQGKHPWLALVVGACVLGTLLLGFALAFRIWRSDHPRDARGGRRRR